MQRLNKDEIKDEVAAFFAGLDVFSDTKDHPEHLAAALEACVPLEFQKGEEIVKQNDFGNSFFVIWTGGAKVLLLRPNTGLVQIESTRPHEVLSLGPGEMFGELSLLAGELREATVMASEPTRVIEVYRNGFENLVRHSPRFKQRMDDLYHQYGKLIHLKRVRILSGLDDESFTLVLAKATLRIYNKGERLFEQDKQIDALYLIKDGYVRVSRKAGAAELIQAYLSEGHCFGQEGMVLPGKWDQTGTAATWVEAIKISCADFRDLIKKRPEVFQKVLASFDGAATASTSGLGGTGVGQTALLVPNLKREPVPATPDIGKTNLLALRPLVEEGYVGAKSMLVMDMELCVRCGNCVRACEATHGGITRLVRRGITIARRKDVNKEGSRQFLQIPTSCLHCKDPECMIGCPTGAITRDLQREVFIQEDICIGCGNCATRCPWGNIAMFPLENKEEKEVAGVTRIVDQLAVKCDLCRGRESSACVYNCPTGACIRIVPTEYFEELKLMGIVPIK